MDCTDHTVDDIPEVLLPANLLSSPTIADVSTRSRCGDEFYGRTSAVGKL